MKRKIPHVFEVSEHGSKAWIMDGRYHVYKQDNGEVRTGRKERFKTKAEAQGRAEAVFNEVFQPAIVGPSLSPAETLDALRATELLRIHNASLLKACEFYADHLKAKSKANMTLAKVAEDWLKTKDGTGMRKQTRSNLNTRITSLLDQEGATKLHEITFKKMHDWIHALPLSVLAKQDYKKTASEMFEWCIFPNEWITVNPCSCIKFKEVYQEKEVSILTVPAAKALFEAAMASNADIRRYVVLCLFVGLRPSEAEKASRGDIQDNGSVRVHAGKTGRFRYVKMETGVEKLLTAKMPGEEKWSGPLIQPNFRNRWDALRVQLGYKVWLVRKKRVDGKQVFYADEAALAADRAEWPHDVMRHTYCSYHLAAFQNEALTAHMAGHDVKVLRKHYRRPIPQKDGLAFWELIKP